jgi:hypothetical protein
MHQDRDHENEAPDVRRDVQDEPVNIGPDGVPEPADPQAGMIEDDDTHEPDAAQPLHPRVGEPIGP